jgi:hypothetical protein
MCQPCYDKQRWREVRERRLAKRPRRRCKFCRRRFRPYDSRALYCERVCQRAYGDLCRAARGREEQLCVTRCRELATAIVRSCIDRDCRRLSKKTGLGSANGPYVMPWRRGPLYIIRVKLPAAIIGEELPAAVILEPPKKKVEVSDGRRTYRAAA